MKLLKGKKEADRILREVGKGIKKHKLSPVLAVVLVGVDKPSKIYVRLKKEAARKIGIGFRLYKFSEKSTQSEIELKIKELNNNKKINGIIIQLPLPDKFNAQKIINSIAPEKDVDGFHPSNQKLFFENKERFQPVFPNAILNLLKSSRQKLKNKKAVIISHSEKFGELMKAMLERNKMKSDCIISKDFKDNFKKIKNYSIVITAVGVPNLITGDIIKEGSIIIDGGITKEGKKTLGDVNFNSAKKLTGFISPVPGGVGPLTVSGLLENVYLATLSQNKK